MQNKQQYLNLYRDHRDLIACHSSEVLILGTSHLKAS